MSHSNSTPNYNLPQFVGTDKPAWLTDINQAFSATDTAIKAAKDAADTAGGDASNAKNSIGTLSDLNTTDKTNLVASINEVNTALGTTSGVASEASGNATSALNKINAFESLFNLTRFQTINANDMTKSNCSVGYGSIRIATNADGSIGKIYGFLQSTVSTSSTTDGYIRFNTNLRPTTTISINDAILAMQHSYTGSPNAEVFDRLRLTIDTNGDVTIPKTKYFYNRQYNLYLPPCLYFMKDFGD